MTSLVRERQSLMFRSRSYTAFALTPKPPLASWLTDLDATLDKSKSFFAGHPVVLNLSAAPLSTEAIADLVADLEGRNIRVLGIEGMEQVEAGAKLPPLLRGGRATRGIALQAPAPVPAASPPKQPVASLLIEHPVRSGQTVAFSEGDVTIVGSVASGAEIIAGGSIHVYGALRGQAMAGAGGNPRARIFCDRFEAELLAIGQHYKTADDIEASLRRGPVQAWLDGETLKISAMN